MGPVETNVACREHSVVFCFVSDISESLKRVHLITIISQEEKIISPKSDSICHSKDSILHKIIELEQEETVETGFLKVEKYPSTHFACVGNETFLLGPQKSLSDIFPQAK